MKRPEDLDRLLAGGRPSGPELDAMWSKVAAQLPDEQPSLWSRLARWLTVGIPVLAATAAAFFLLPGRTIPGADEFAARGGGSGTSAGPQLSSSCGTQADPCKVGQPVFLRVLNLPGGAGVAHVAMLVDGKYTWLVEGESVNSAANALHVKIVPEAADVKTGISLRMWISNDAISPDVRNSLLRETSLEPFTSLHLVVVP